MGRVGVGSAKSDPCPTLTAIAWSYYNSQGVSYEERGLQPLKGLYKTTQDEENLPGDKTGHCNVSDSRYRSYAGKHTEYCSTRYSEKNLHSEKETCIAFPQRTD